MLPLRAQLNAVTNDDVNLHRQIAINPQLHAQCVCSEGLYEHTQLQAGCKSSNSVMQHNSHAHVCLGVMKN